MLMQPPSAGVPHGRADMPPQQNAALAAASGSVLDAAALAGLRALDPTGQNRLMERVFTAFRTSTGRLLPQLLESQRNADLGGMRHVAHTLKSSAASVGGLKLSGICADLETQVRLGETSALQPQVKALVDEAESLLLALQRMLETGR